MPELPEVETVLRTLEHQIKGREILSVRVLYKPIVADDPKQFASRLQNQHFCEFRRRGKYLLFYMDDVLLVSHLRMEGKYYLQHDSEPIDKHIHVIFQLDHNLQLRYRDTRKFGRMELMPKDTDMNTFHNLGPEPFDDAFSPQYIKKYCRNRKEPVKTLLLDQHFTAGIGNIYADEILFSAGIKPSRRCCTLTVKNCTDIVNETRRILKAAITAGGTTIRTYTSSLGVSGLFQLQCCVHEQKICPECGSQIKMKWIGGRSSYYCARCQK